MIFLLIYIIGSAKNQLASLKGNVFPFVKQAPFTAQIMFRGSLPVTCPPLQARKNTKHTTSNVGCCKQTCKTYQNTWFQGIQIIVFPAPSIMSGGCLFETIKVAIPQILQTHSKRPSHAPSQPLRNSQPISDGTSIPWKWLVAQFSGAVLPMPHPFVRGHFPCGGTKRWTKPVRWTSMY